MTAITYVGNKSDFGIPKQTAKLTLLGENPGVECELGDV